MKVLETTGEVTQLTKDLTGTNHTFKLSFLGGLVVESTQNTIKPTDLFGKQLKLTISTIEPAEFEEKCERCGTVITRFDENQRTMVIKPCASADIELGTHVGPRKSIEDFERKS